MTHCESRIAENGAAECMSKSHSVRKLLLSRLGLIFDLESTRKDGDEEIETEVAAEEGDEEEVEEGADTDSGGDGTDLRGPVVAGNEFEGEKKRRTDIGEGEDSEGDFGTESAESGSGYSRKLRALIV